MKRIFYREIRFEKRMPPFATAGFTLVEIIVASALFVTLTVMASGAVLTVMNSNKEIRAASASSGHLESVFQYMSREVRDGFDYKECFPLPGDWEGAWYVPTDECECFGLPGNFSDASYNCPAIDAAIRASLATYPNAEWQTARGNGVSAREYFCGRGGFRFKAVEAGTSHIVDRIYRRSCDYDYIEYSAWVDTDYTGGNYDKLGGSVFAVKGFRTRVIPANDTQQEAVLINLFGYLYNGNGMDVPAGLQTTISKRLNDSFLK